MSFIMSFIAHSNSMSKAEETALLTRMHSSRMRTVCCRGHLSYHACSPCHACPPPHMSPATHDPSPLPRMPHPSPCTPFTTHAPPLHHECPLCHGCPLHHTAPLCHACPLCHAQPPPPVDRQTPMKT